MTTSIRFRICTRVPESGMGAAVRRNSTRQACIPPVRVRTDVFPAYDLSRLTHTTSISSFFLQVFFEIFPIYFSEKACSDRRRRQTSPSPLDKPPGGARPPQAAPARQSGDVRHYTAKQPIGKNGTPAVKPAVFPALPKQMAFCFSVRAALDKARRRCYNEGNLCRKVGAKMQKAYIIGIAGGSAGGKTTFARQLQTALADIDVLLLSMDACFRAGSRATVGRRKVPGAALPGRQLARRRSDLPRLRRDAARGCGKRRLPRPDRRRPADASGRLRAVPKWSDLRLYVDCRAGRADRAAAPAQYAVGLFLRRNRGRIPRPRAHTTRRIR